jgi:hypothetical protein
MKTNRSLIQIVLLFCTLFFSAIAIIQYLFVENETKKASIAQLDDWANEVSRGLNYIDHWDSKKYRQAAIAVPGWYIITEEGMIYDIETFIPDIIPSPKYTNRLIPLKPISITTETGEIWRLIYQPVIGGAVLLGIPDPSDLSFADKMLFKNTKLFDSKALSEAIQVPAREIDNDIEYAVVDSQGNVKQQWGGIPARLDHATLGELQRITTEKKIVNGKIYLIQVKPIISINHKVVGRIIVPLDITLQQQAMRMQEQFNFIVVGVSWLTIIIVIIVIYVTNKKRRREQEISLEEALKRGEGQSIEFKAGVLDDILPKTIAAFANTEGGNIFFGVNDNGVVVGLIEKSTKEKDILLQKIRSSVDQSITPRLSLYPTFIEYDNKIVLRLFVPTGTRPIYLVGGIAYIRQMNSVVRARAEDLESRFKKWTT